MCCEALPRHARLHLVRCNWKTLEFMFRGTASRWPLTPLKKRSLLQFERSLMWIRFLRSTSAIIGPS